MGDRIFIELQSQDFDTPVVIYAYWAGEAILGAVTEVLGITNRIGDPNYLAAQIIHNVFKQCDYDGVNSFGIAAWNYQTAMEAYDWADNPTIYVDLDTGKYYIGDSDQTFNRFGQAA
jgi:hypothetical protein